MKEPTSHLPLSRYAGRVYRNFPTLVESQDLMDDLAPDPEQQRILEKFFYDDDHRWLAPIERIMKKSVQQIIQEQIDAKFQPSVWQASRYSDGTWAVLYTAESEETALREALFHMRRFYAEELTAGTLRVQRRVLSIFAVSVACVDLTMVVGLDCQALVSQDESGYLYCQSLARSGIHDGAELLRAPSARDPDGHTVPIFNQEVAKDDEGHLKYLRCVLKPDGSAEVTGMIEEKTKKYP